LRPYQVPKIERRNSLAGRCTQLLIGGIRRGEQVKELPAHLYAPGAVGD
jgi:hypothetical protein